MRFEKGNLRDKNEIEQILKRVVKANLNSGVRWNEEYPTIEILERDIRNEELYVLRDAERIIGLVVINENVDGSYKTLEWETKEGESFIALHRLMVDTLITGKGYGKVLIKEIEKYAIENNVYSIKLDTSEENEKAINLYKTMGYIKKGGVNFTDVEGIFVCFEKILKKDIDKNK